MKGRLKNRLMEALIAALTAFSQPTMSVLMPAPSLPATATNGNPRSHTATRHYALYSPGRMLVAGLKISLK